MAHTGLSVEPTSASVAAVLSAGGAIRANERTVVIISGTGIKAASLITELLGAS